MEAKKDSAVKAAQIDNIKNYDRRKEMNKSIVISSMDEEAAQMRRFKKDNLFEA